MKDSVKKENRCKEVLRIGRKMELLSIELPLCAKCCPHLHKHSHLNLTSAL